MTQGARTEGDLQESCHQLGLKPLATAGFTLSVQEWAGSDASSRRNTGYRVWQDHQLGAAQCQGSGNAVPSLPCPDAGRLCPFHSAEALPWCHSS